MYVCVYFVEWCLCVKDIKKDRDELLDCDSYMDKRIDSYIDKRIDRD